MAEVTETYGIDLQIEGFETFQNESKALDKALDDLSASIDRIVTKLNEINLGKVKFNASQLVADSSKLDATADGLARYSGSVEKLARALTDNIAEQALALNKAIGGGARANTIVEKASGIGKLGTQVKKLTEVPRIGGTAREVSELFSALSSANSGSAANIDNLRNIVTATVRTFRQLEKLDTSKVDVITGTTLKSVAEAIRQFNGLQIDRIASQLPAFADGLGALSKAVRSFTQGKNIAALPDILRTTVAALQALILSMRNLGNETGDSTVINNIKLIAEAIKSLSLAIRSFQKTSGSASDISDTIDRAIGSVQKLAQAFNSQELRNIDFTIGPIADALGSLTKAFDSLGRRKGFTEFPQLIDAMNVAIQKLDVNTLRDLGAKIEEAVGPLRDLAEVASSLRKLEKATTTSFKAQRAEALQLRAANVQLGAAFIQLGSAIAPVIPVVARFGVTLLKLPIKAVAASLRGLRAIFISFPLKVVSTGFGLVTKAVSGTLNIFKAIGDRIRLVDRQFKLISRTLNIVLAPFRLVLNVVRALIGALGNLASALGKAASALNPFNRGVKDAAKNVRDASDATKNVDTVLEGVGKGARDASIQVNNYNATVEDTGKASRVAAGALGVFGAALATRGVQTAVKRLVSMTIALRTISTLSRVAGSAFQFLTQRIGELVRNTFNITAQFEQLRLSINALAAIEAIDAGQFTDILPALKGTQEVADEYLETLRKMAFASPFSRDDIAQGFRLAQVYGFAGKEAIGLTQVLVDTAAAIGLSGAQIKELVLPIGQIGSTGRASLEDLKQLAERGVPIFAALEQIRGTTGAQLREDISASLVSATDVFEAVALIGQQFSGIAAESTTTLQGLLATASDLRDNALRSFFEGAIAPVKELATELLTLDNIKIVTDFARGLGVEFGVRLKSAIETLVSVITTFRAIVAGIPQPIKDVIGNLARFAAIVSGVSIGLGLLGTAFTFLATTAFVLINPLNLIIGTVVALGVTVTRNFGNITGAFQSFGQAVLELPSFIATLVGSVVNVINTGNVATTVFADFTSILQSVGIAINGSVGLIITLGDAFQQLIKNGEIALHTFIGLPPAFKAVGESIANLANFVVDLVNDFRTGFNSMLNIVSTSTSRMQEFFVGILTNVTDFGSGLIQAFADGIIGSLNVVANALGELGNLITFWLAPGSPPRLLPDIDQWGTDAASEFLGGFGKADFDIIDDFGSTVERLLRTLDIEGVNAGPIVQEFAEGLAQLQQTGEFDDSFLDSIGTVAGAANVEVTALASKFADLAVEQSALTAATREYEDALRGAQGVVSALDAADAIEGNEAKIKDLQGTLNNAFVTEEEAARTRAQIDRLQAENRVKQLEQQRAQQEALTSNAQAAIEAQQQQLALAEQFGAETDALTDGAGGTSASGRVKKPKEPKSLKGDAEKALSSVADVFKNFTPDFSSLESAGASVSSKFAETRDRVSQAFTDIQERVNTAITNVTTTLDSFGLTANRLRLILIGLGVVILGPQVVGAFSALAVVLAPLVTPLGLVAAAVIGATAGFVALAQQTGSIEGAFEAIGNSFNTLAAAFTSATVDGSVLDVLSNLDLTSLDSIASAIGEIGGIVVARLTTFFTNLPTTIATLWDSFVASVTTTIEASGGIAGVLVNAFGDFGTVLNDNLVQPIVDALTSGNETVLGKVSGAVSSYVSGVATIIAGGFLDLGRLVSEAIKGEPVTLGPELPFIGPTLDELSFFDSSTVSTIAANTQSDVTFLSNNVAQAFEEANPAIRIENAIREWFSGIDVVGAVTGLLNDSAIGQTIEANVQEFVRNVFGFEGFDVSDAFGDVAESIGGVLQTIGDAFNSFTEAVGGDNPLANILAENADAFREFFDEVTDPEFVAALGTIAQALGIAAGAILGLAAAIVDGLLIGLLRNIGDIVIGVADGLNLFGEAFQQLVSGNVLGALGTALNGLGTIFDSVLGGIAQIAADAVKAILEFVGIDTSGPLGTFIDLAANLVLTLVPVVGQIGKVTTGVRGFIAAISNPKLLQNFVAGFKSLPRFFAPVTKFFKNIVKSVGAATGVFNKYLTVVKGLLTPLFNLGKSIGQFSALFGGVGDFVSSLTEDFRAWGAGLIDAFLEGITTAAAQVGTFILRTLSAPFTFWLSTNSPPRFLPDVDQWGLGTALEFLAGFASAPLAAIFDFASGVGGAIATAFSPTTILGLIASLAQAIAGLPWQEVSSTITEFFLENVVAPLGNLASFFGVDLSALGDVLISALRAALLRVGQFILNNVSLIQRFQELFSSFIAWLNQATPQWVVDIVSAIGSAFSSVFGFLGAIFGPILKFVTDAAGEIGRGIASAFNIELPSFSDILTFIEDNITTPLMSIGPRIGQGILDGISAVFGEGAADTVESVFNLDLGKLLDFVVPQALQDGIALVLQLNDIQIPANPLEGWTLGDVLLKAIDFILNPVGTIVNPFLKWFLPEDVADLISILLDVGLAIFNPIRLWAVPANLFKLVRLLTGALKVTNIFDSLKIPSLITKFVNILSGVNVVNPLGLLKIPEGVQAVVDFFQGRINPFEGAVLPTPISDFVGAAKTFFSTNPFSEWSLPEPISSFVNGLANLVGVDVENPFAGWTFTDVVQSVIRFLTNPIGALVSPFTNWLLPEGVADVVNLVIGTVTSAFNPLGIWALPGKLVKIFNLISGAETVSNIMSDFALPESVSSVFDFISQPISNPFTNFALPDSITSFFDTLSGGVSVGLTSLGEGASSLVDSVSTPLSNFNEEIPEFLSGLVTSTIDFFKNDFYPIVGETLAGLGTVLSEGVTTVATEWDLSEIVRTITSFFVSAGITTVTVVSDFFSQVLSAFVDGITFLVTEVDYGEILTSFSTFVTDTLIPGVLGFGKEVGLGLIQGILDAFGVDSDSLFANIASSINSAIEPIQAFFDNVGSRLEAFKESLTFLNVIPGVNIGDADVEGEEDVVADIQKQIDDTVIKTNPEITVGDENTDFSGDAAKLIAAFNTAYDQNGGTFVTDFAAINASLIEQGFTAADIANIAETAGLEVPAGLAAGLNDDDQVLDRAARQLPADLIQAIKDELGVESPSTVARDEVAAFVVAGLAEGLTANLAPLTAATESLVQSLVESLQGAVASVGVNPLARLVTLPPTLVASVTNAFSTLFSNVLSSVSSFSTAYSDDTATLYATEVGATGAFSSVTSDIYEELYRDVIEQTEDWGVDFLRTIETVRDEAIELFTQLKDGALEEVEKLSTGSLSKLRGLIVSIEALAPEFEGAGKLLGQSTVDGVVESLQSNTQRAVDEVSKLASDMKANLPLIAVWFDAGEFVGAELVNGIISGLEKRKAALQREVADLANETKKTVQREGGISSPSTVWRDDIGVPWVQGLELGVLQQLPSLLATAIGVATDTVSAVASTFSSVGDDVGTPLVNDIASGVQAASSTLVSAATDAAEQASEAFVNVFGESGEELSSVLTRQVGSAIIDGTGEAEAVTTSTSTSIEVEVSTSGSAVGRTFVQDVAASLSEGSDDLSEAMDNLLTDTTALAVDIVRQQAPSVGLAYVNGVIEGINAGSPLLEDAVVRLSQRTVDVARATLGIASPSKVSFARVGMPFVDGVVNALRSGRDSVGRSVAGLFGTVGAQPVDVRYRGLMTKLPTLSQAIRAHVLPYEQAALTSSQQVTAMGVGSTSNNATTHNYNYYVTTTPQRATRMRKSMRTMRMRMR